MGADDAMEKTIQEINPATNVATNGSTNASDGSPEPEITKPNFILGIDFHERTTDPPPGLCWYKVKSGDSLAGLADCYNLSWMDFCLINFRTLDPARINWYLRHRVGCTQHNGKWYTFSDGDDPGMLLVPFDPKDHPAFNYDDEPVTVRAVAGKKVTVEIGMGVEVFERSRTGAVLSISGKWLYVFSAPGLTFGYQLARRTAPVPSSAAADPEAPGSAFTSMFPAQTHVGGIGPDRLDYEIYITPEAPPQPEHIAYIGGDAAKAALNGPERYARAWYFFSDPNLLAQTLRQPRSQRSRHAFGNRRRVRLPISGEPRCYFFLLSPFQLGPAALAFALQHPEALTPLIDPYLQTSHWESHGDLLPVTAWRGPDLSAIKQRPLRICVVDPYAWAESIAQDLIHDDVKQYRQWLSRKDDGVLQQLKQTTGWEAETFFLANSVKALRDAYPDPATFDRTIKEPVGYCENLALWYQGLSEEHGRHVTRIYQDVAELSQWMDSPAHHLFDLALCCDTDSGRPEDLLDTAWGLFHYLACLEPCLLILPGRNLINSRFSRQQGFLWQHMRLVFDASVRPATNAGLALNKKLGALRYAHSAVLRLIGIRLITDTELPLVSDKKRSVSLNTIFQDLAGRINDLKLFPGRLVVGSIEADSIKKTTAPSPLSATKPVYRPAVLTVEDNLAPMTVDARCPIRSTSIRAKWAAAAMEARFHHLASEPRQPEDETPPVMIWETRSSACALAVLNICLVLQKGMARITCPEQTTPMVLFNNMAQTVFADLACQIVRLAADPFLKGELPDSENQKQNNESVPDKALRAMLPWIDTTWGNDRACATLVSTLAAGWLHANSPDKPIARKDWSTSAVYHAGTKAANIVHALAYALRGEVFAMAEESLTGSDETCPIDLLFAAATASMTIKKTERKLSEDNAFMIWASHCHFGTNADDHPQTAWAQTGKYKMEKWSIAEQRKALTILIDRLAKVSII